MTPTEFKESTLKELKTYVLGIIRYEATLDDKLSLLTEIGLTSKNEITFKACEEIRSEICEAERSDNGADIRERSDESVASECEGEETSDILQTRGSSELHDQNGLRKKLETVLSTLNAKKQKTFEFEGLEFNALLVKHFLKECKKLPDLAVEVYPENEAMFLNWSNGNAKIHAYPLAEKIKAKIKEEQEMLK